MTNQTKKSKIEKAREISISKQSYEAINKFINKQEKVIEANSDLLKASNQILKKLERSDIDNFEEVKQIAILQTKAVMKLAFQFNFFYKSIIDYLNRIIKTGKGVF